MLFMRFLAPCAAALLLRVGVVLCLPCAVLRCVPLPSCMSRSPSCGEGHGQAPHPGLEANSLHTAGPMPKGLSACCQRKRPLSIYGVQVCRSGTAGHAGMCEPKGPSVPVRAVLQAFCLWRRLPRAWPASGLPFPPPLLTLQGTFRALNAIPVNL